MAGGGEVESEAAADTRAAREVTIAVRHLTISSWKESGRLGVAAHLRLLRARWNKSSEAESLSWSEDVVVITSVSSAEDNSPRPSSQAKLVSDSAYPAISVRMEAARP